MTPIQADWTSDSIDLSPDVLRTISVDNAFSLLAKTWPGPTLRARPHRT